MELLFITTTLGLCIFLSSIFLSINLLLFRYSKPTSALPPGKTGWPVIGESFQYLSAGWKGHQEKFVLDRMSKYSSAIFRTNLFGENFAVLCGPSGNKFLFSNENKLVQNWWPKSLKKILPTADDKASKNAGFNHLNMLGNFLKAEAIQRYIPVMDHISRRHFADEWDNKDQVTVFPMVHNYTFLVAYCFLFSVEDPDRLCKFRDKFNGLISGLVSVPIALPGTQYWKSIKTAEWLQKEFVAIIRQRKIELEEGKASPTQDVLSRMLVTRDENGKSMGELDIANNIIGLLIAGHDTLTSACVFIVKYLAELPHVYDAVYKEQMEIAKSKGDGELLNWQDLQKMKYSWNVACEVMRFTPPAAGGFREAITDFTYKDFFVPKGWKLYWSAFSTHKNPEFFPEPEKFDPSRFEGSGPAPYTFVPFGGGPHVCTGKEFARAEILVFMHHMVKRFKWEKIIPNEKILWNPTPIPAKGLPIKLYPHIIN